MRMAPADFEGLQTIARLSECMGYDTCRGPKPSPREHSWIHVC